MAVCGELNLKICYLSLSSSSLTDNSLADLLNSTPEQSVVVLEDVDVLFTKRDLAMSLDKGKSGVVSSLSFSGLLNALDGVASQDGRITIMTTNHLERLDPALVRPGRCDVRIKLDYTSAGQAASMFRSFYPTANERTVQAFSSRIPTGVVTPAALQGYFLQNRDDPDSALANVNQLLHEVAESRGGQHVVRDKPVREWLMRLGLAQYVNHFARWRLVFVSDVLALGIVENPSLLGTIGVTQAMHSARITASLAGLNEYVLRGYALASTADVLDLLVRAFPAGAQREACEALAGRVPDDTLSVFQVQQALSDATSLGEAQRGLERQLDLVRAHLDAPNTAGALLLRESELSIMTIDRWLDSQGVPADAAEAATLDDVLAACVGHLTSVHGMDAASASSLIDKLRTGLAEQGIALPALVRALKLDELSKFGLAREGDRWLVHRALCAAHGKYVRANLARAGWQSFERFACDASETVLESAGLSDPDQRWSMLRDLKTWKSKFELAATAKA